MRIKAEASLYPLKTIDINDPVEEFCRTLKNRGLHLEIGNMSTLISGETDEVFDGLKAAMAETGEKTSVVLVVKFSNACPSRAPEDGDRLPLF